MLAIAGSAIVGSAIGLTFAQITGDPRPVATSPAGSSVDTSHRDAEVQASRHTHPVANTVVATFRDRLAALEATLDTVTAHREDLDRDLGAALTQLARSNRKTVEIAAALDDLGQRLEAVESQITDSLERETALREALRDDTRSIEHLTRPMLAASRLPVPLTLATTRDPLRAARSVMVAGSVMAAVEARVASVRVEIDNLTAVGSQLADERRLLVDLGRQEGERLAELDRVIDAKRQTVTTLSEARSSASGQIEDLTTLAQTLESTVATMEREAQRIRDARVRREAVGRLAAAPDRRAVDLPALLTMDTDWWKDVVDLDDGVDRQELAQAGIQLPVWGPIIAAYGDPDRFGDPLPGMRIATRPGGPIVAPIDGDVRFAGELGGYGLLLILGHGDEYHSLIAGLGRILVETGDEVAAGEQLGAAPASQNGQNTPPRIYFEVRWNGQPVSPIDGLAQAQERGRG